VSGSGDLLDAKRLRLSLAGHHRGAALKTPSRANRLKTQTG
jgi:hypothetical protein